MYSASSSEEIQLLFSSLSGSKEFEKYLCGLLSPDEQERADCFRHEKHRRSFIVARGLLRVILGNFMNVDLATIAFDYGQYGKPVIQGAPRVHFNVSHSEGIVLYGLRLDYPIGVDVERIRPIDGLEDIARQFFSPAEYRNLLVIPDMQRKKAFFDCWTRKEAFIKFLGAGLSFPLDRFRVSLGPGEPARLIEIDGQPPRSCFLEDIAPSDAYAAAVVSEGQDSRFRVWMLERPEEVEGLWRDCGDDRCYDYAVMAETDEEDLRQYKVVINREVQYSIWLADREYPLGWSYAGFSGTKAECLAYIGKVWTDMRPLSLRKTMGDAPR